MTLKVLKFFMNPIFQCITNANIPFFYFRYPLFKVICIKIHLYLSLFLHVYQIAKAKIICFAFFRKQRQILLSFCAMNTYFVIFYVYASFSY